MTGPAAPLLQADSLAKRFAVREPGLFGRRLGTVNAVNGVSFALTAGETFAVVGESGCGKSTLARTLVGLYAPDAGTLRFDGQTVPFGRHGTSERDMRRRMQMIFQDPYASLNPRMTAGEAIAEPLVIHRIGTPAGRRDRARETAEAVGLSPSDLIKYPHQFSGGERQRIAIARALVAGPELVIADEPLSSLDVSIQAQIVNLLADLRMRHDLTYLLISHDLSVVAYMADRVAVMYLGRIVETASAESVFENPLHPYTRALIEAAPRLGRGRRRRRAVVLGEPASPITPPSGCPFHPRCPKAGEICENTRPELAPPPGGSTAHTVACHFPGTM